MAFFYNIFWCLLAWYTSQTGASNVYQLHASYIDDADVHTRAVGTAVTALDASVCSRRTTVVQVTVTEKVYGSSTSSSSPSSDGIQAGSLSRSGYSYTGPSAPSTSDSVPGRASNLSSFSILSSDGGTVGSLSSNSSTGLPVPSTSNSDPGSSINSSSFQVPSAATTMIMPVSYYTGTTPSATTVYSGSLAFVEAFQPYLYLTQTSGYSGSTPSFSTVLPSSGSAVTVIEYLPTDAGADETISTTFTASNSTGLITVLTSTSSVGPDGINDTSLATSTVSSTSFTSGVSSSMTSTSSTISAISSISPTSSTSASSSSYSTSPPASGLSSISSASSTNSTTSDSNGTSHSSSSSVTQVSTTLVFIDCPTPMPVDNSDFATGLEPWVPSTDPDSTNTVAPSMDGHDDAASMRFSLSGGDPSPVSLAQQVDLCQNATYAVSFWYNQNAPEDAITSQSYLTVSVDGIVIMSMHGGSPDGSMNAPIGQWYKSRAFNFTAAANSSWLELAVSSNGTTPVSLLVDDFGLAVINGELENATDTLQNLLYDGDFSLADMAAGENNLVGWTWGTDGNMDLQTSADVFVQNTYAYFADGTLPPKINGSAISIGCGRDDAYVFLSQTIATAPGSLYVASFWYWLFPGASSYDGSAQIHIKIDGATLWSASTLGGLYGWQQGSMTFVAVQDTTLFEFRLLCQQNTNSLITAYASDFSVTLGDDSIASVCGSQPLSNAGFDLGLNSWTSSPSIGAITSSQFADGTPAADMMCTSNETITLSQTYTACPGATYRVSFTYWIDPHYATESNPATIVINGGMETISTWALSSILPIDNLGNSIGNQSVPDVAYFTAISIHSTFQLSLACSNAPMHVQIANILLEMVIDESSFGSILPNGNFSQGIEPWGTLLGGISSIALVQSGFDDDVSLLVVCGPDDDGTPGDVSLSQTVPTIAGYSYEVSYWYIAEVTGEHAEDVTFDLYANDDLISSDLGYNVYAPFFTPTGFWLPADTKPSTFLANSNSTTISWVLSCPYPNIAYQVQMQIDNFVLRPSAPGYTAWTDTDEAHQYPLSSFSGDFETAQLAPWIPSRSGNGNYATLTSPGNDDSTQAALLYCTGTGAAAIAQSFDTMVNAYYEVQLEYLANCSSGTYDGILAISTDRQFPEVTSPPSDSSWTSLLMTLQANTTFTELSLNLLCQSGSDNTLLIDNVMVTPTIVADGEMTEENKWWSNNPYSNYNATGYDDASSWGMICQDNQAAFIQQNILLDSPSGNADYVLQFYYQHWDWSVASGSGTDIPPLFEMWLDGTLLSAFAAGSPSDSNDGVSDYGWHMTTAPIHMAPSSTQHSLQLVLQCAGTDAAISANLDVVSIQEQQQSTQNTFQRRQPIEACPIIGDNLITNGDFECDSNTIADWIVVGKPSLWQSGCCENGIQSVHSASIQCSPPLDPNASPTPEDVSIQQTFTTVSRQ